LIKTEIIILDPEKPDIEKIKYAAFILKKGGLVVFPTETVYGIGANLLNSKSIERLCSIKKRPKGKLFSIHVADKSKIELFSDDIPVAAYKLIDKFWPGPLTIILKSKEKDIRTVGLRMPNNRIALDLISAAEVPIVAPSANIAGKSAPKTLDEALMDLDGKVDVAIDGRKTILGVSSSVVDLTVSPPEVVREGVIKKSDIEKAIRKKNILFVCTGNSCRSVMAKELLKKKLKNRDDVEVRAAGVGAFPGMRATLETQELLEAEGIDVSNHQAQQLTDDLLKRADLILVMQKQHEHTILRKYPFAKNRLYLLKEFAKIQDGDLDIPDPMGQSKEFYRECFLVIKQAVEKIAGLI